MKTVSPTIIYAGMTNKRRTLFQYFSLDIANPMPTVRREWATYLRYWLEHALLLKYPENETAERQPVARIFFEEPNMAWFFVNKVIGGEVQCDDPLELNRETMTDPYDIVSAIIMAHGKYVSYWSSRLKKDVQRVQERRKLFTLVVDNT